MAAGTTDSGATCSFCGRGFEETGALTSGRGEAAICSDCIGRFAADLSTWSQRPATDEHGLAHLYRSHFRNPRRERQFLASVSFFFTFLLVRFIVRSIQKGHGPFRNVSAGGKHIHHLVWGILLLLLVGLIWLHQIGTGVLPPRRLARTTAVLYGAGSALTLDEFALWLNLSDVYFTPEGRESIDAVIGFGSLLSIGFWGGPFLNAAAKHIFRKRTAQPSSGS